MSRMERYYKTSSTLEKRSNRNKDLYKSIYDISEYSNIEGIATIGKNNEINITKVQNTIKNREEYHKQKNIRPLNNKIEEISYDNNFDVEEKNYDIRDILIKAKNNKPKDNYHNLNYETISYPEKKLKVEDPELENLIDKIESTSKLNKLSDKDLGLDIFSSLKSENTATIIQDRDSVRKLLDEAKKEEKDDTNTGLDKSFFTSSLSFKDDDFEQIAQLNNNIKKNNILIKVLVFIMLLIITGIIIFFVYNKLK